MEITVEEFKKQFPRFTPVYLPIYKQGKTYFQGDVVFYNQFIQNGTVNTSNDVIEYSGAILSFNTPLTCITGYTNQPIIKTNLLDVNVSASADGTYNVIIPEIGNQPYINNNYIIVDNEIPPDVDVDTIPIMTSNNEPSGVASATESENSQLAYTVFQQGYVPSSIDWHTNALISSGVITYTYTENDRPKAGLYHYKRKGGWSQGGLGSGTINTIEFIYIDDTKETVTPNSSIDFENDITLTKTLKEIKINMVANRGGFVGAFQFIQKAITTEGTLWVDNSADVVKVMARDNQGAWQPFNDVLSGNITVASGIITSAIQPQYSNVIEGDVEDYNLFYRCKVEMTTNNPTDTNSWEITNQTVLNYTQDSDIENAMAEARVNFNESLFGDDAKMIFLYLTAYYLTVDFKNALGQNHAGVVTSKSVGSVSESYGVPQWMLKDRILGAYAQNGYGLKYLSLINPYLVGNVMFFRGATTI